MKTLLLSFAALILTLLAVTPAVRAGNPNLHELKMVAQLPPEMPQRIMGLAYDGENLWASIYLGRGRYAKLDPSTLSWALENEAEVNRAIVTAAGAFQTAGGLCFVNGTLWVAGAYGQSFGSIEMGSWEVKQLFKGKQREDNASQSYSSVAHDGTNLWIAWHWFRYNLPMTETQLLLKVDPESGKVLAEYPGPGGTRNDGTHGLTWDGSRLWHMKDKKLSAIDPSTGAITAQFFLEGLKRPSGLAWAKDALWIAEFDGKIWRLPFSS